VNAVDSGHLAYPPDRSLWETPDMRAALAARDVTRMYRLLQKHGYSQQRIGAMTGQSQPEVSAIIHGRRIMAYDVLCRIADGLDIPRGHMGLAYADNASSGGSAPAGTERQEPLAVPRQSRQSGGTATEYAATGDAATGGEAAVRESGSERGDEDGGEMGSLATHLPGR
jgi:transcriptional regulator with XRE-family HTH domain